MIRFACTCKHVFNLPEDEAGGLTQCPRCGRLNDVPTLSDLPNLTEDGTYKVETPRQQDDPFRVAELELVYGKGTRDAKGEEVDLRTTVEELEEAGDDIPLAPREGERDPASKTTLPRYDPVTGELIRPLELKTDPEHADPATIPMAKAVISYAAGPTDKRVPPARILLELFLPANLVVLGFIFVSVIFYQVLMISPAAVLAPLGVPMEALYLPVFILMLAHVGNTIEDTGANEHDELTRPLRDLSFGDDLWGPFTRMALALGLCYAPAIVAGVYGSPRPWAAPLAASLWFLGGFVAPAVMLTVITSGSIHNLRPDRLWRVVRAGRLHYLLSAIVWIFAAPATLIGVAGARWIPDPVTERVPLLKMLDDQLLFVLFPLLAVGVYFIHFFAWHLGLIYRAHHEQFGWAFQRHVRDPSRALARSTVQTGLGPPRKSTKAKLRELREAERKRRAQGTLVDQALDRPTSGPGPFDGLV